MDKTLFCWKNKSASSFFELEFVITSKYSYHNILAYLDGGGGHVLSHLPNVITIEEVNMLNSFLISSSENNKCSS